MNTLDTIITEYPHFFPDQVLTSQHLNGLADYLEQQTRLSRQKLIGIGIACGLEAHYAVSGSETTVKISRGVGVTSEGQLVHLPSTERTHARPFDGTDHPPFDAASGIFELLETPDDDVDPAVKQLSENASVGKVAVAGKVVALLLEKADRRTDICLDDSCDRKGRKYAFTVRILLIENSDMAAITASLPSLRQHAIAATLDEFALPRVFIPRVGLNGAFGRVGSKAEFIEAYRDAIQDGGDDLRNALDELYNRYRPLVDAQTGHNTNPFSGLDAASAFADARSGNVPVQYVYDWILDIAASYEELRDKVFELTGQCSPDPGLFPHHLVLGRLDATPYGRYDPGDYDPPDQYRTRFIPSPIHDQQRALLLEIKQLIQRIVLLIDGFRGDQELARLTDVVITPTAGCDEPVGKRAIPYYYRVVEDQIHRYWDFDAGRRDETQRHFSYHAAGYAIDDGVSNPLAFGTCPHPQLRIEGHVGNTVNEAVGKLKELRNAFNLDFDMVVLGADRRSRSVFLPDDSKIADLQAAYLVIRNEFVCCARDLARALRDQLKAQPDLDALLSAMIAQLGDDPLTKRLSLFTSGTSLAKTLGLYIGTVDDLIAALPADIKELDLPRFAGALGNFNDMSRSFLNAVSCVFRPFMARLEAWSGEYTRGYKVHAMLADEEGDAGREALIESLRSLDNLEIKVDTRSRATSTIGSNLCLIVTTLSFLVSRLMDDCVQSEIETIYRLFAERVEKISSLSRFVEECPGVEHIAGTTQGGTFILVVEDQARVERRVRVRDPANRFLRRERFEVDIGSHTVDLESDNEGFLNVDVPEAMREIHLARPGTAVETVELREDETPSVRLRTLTEDTVAELSTFSVNPIRARSADIVLNRAMLNDELINAGLLEDADDVVIGNLIPGVVVGDADTDVGLDPSAGTRRPSLSFDFVSGDQLRVIGDFYMPGKLPSHDLQTPIVDVCERKDEKPVLAADILYKDAKAKFEREIRDL